VLRFPLLLTGECRHESVASRHVGVRPPSSGNEQKGKKSEEAEAGNRPGLTVVDE
jgi:hypothetical protein